VNPFYAQGAHRALVDLGLEKDAAWPALVDIPALSRRVLAPITRRLEQRELRQGLDQLRKALPTAQPGPVAGSVRLMGPNGQPITVSSRALDEALGVTPITTTTRTPAELLPTPVTKSAGQLGAPSTSPSFKASPNPLATNKGPTQPVDVQMVPLGTGSVPGSVPGGTVGPKKEYANTGTSQAQNASSNLFQ
jgi:hypothetical protein